MGTLPSQFLSIPRKLSSATKLVPPQRSRTTRFQIIYFSLQFVFISGLFSFIRGIYDTLDGKGRPPNPGTGGIPIPAIGGGGGKPGGGFGTPGPGGSGGPPKIGGFGGPPTPGGSGGGANGGPGGGANGGPDKGGAGAPPGGLIRLGGGILGTDAFYEFFIYSITFSSS